MLGDMAKMMKQAKDLKSKLKEAEKELASLEVEGSSKNRLVVCKMDGKLNLRGIKIEPELVQKGDHTLLEKSVAEAVTEALKEAQNAASSRISGVTGGMNLPGLF